MATAIVPPISTGISPETHTALPATTRTRSLASRMAMAGAAACVVIFVLTFILSLTLPVPMAANIGFAVFLTFWLGGGFGLIAAGSSIADHLH